jgi:hypothetical protein
LCEQRNSRLRTESLIASASAGANRALLPFCAQRNYEVMSPAGSACSPGHDAPSSIKSRSADRGAYRGRRTRKPVARGDEPILGCTVGSWHEVAERRVDATSAAAHRPVACAGGTIAVLYSAQSFSPRPSARLPTAERRIAEPRTFLTVRRGDVGFCGGAGDWTSLDVRPLTPPGRTGEDELSLMVLAMLKAGVAIIRTTRASKRLRALLCVMLSAALSVPFVFAGTSAGERQNSVQILALAGPSLATLVNRAGQRAEHARQCTALNSPFILASVHGRASDRGQLSTAVEHPWPYTPYAARTQSGRSPPLAIS